MNNNPQTMTPSERKSSIVLASLFSFRMLGLFMILPIFSVYAVDLEGATPTLIGLTLGIYGFTQAICQIPFGILSDKLGRKKIISLGLVLFALGSIVAAFSQSIYGVIFGRALQGGGAIGSVVIALLADLTREEQRTKAMAIIGIAIAVSFALAMGLGPLLGVWIGLSGIFLLTAVLAVLGLWLVYYYLPTPVNLYPLHAEGTTWRTRWYAILGDSELRRLNFGIFTLHAILTATFVALPIALQELLHWPAEEQWCIYLPALLISFMMMFPLALFAERRQKTRALFLIAVTTLVTTEILLVWGRYSLVVTMIALVAFLTAFTLLESFLPSLLSKVAPPEHKGAAMGMYSTSQFLGIFLGGLSGGWLLGTFAVQGVYGFAAILASIWVWVAIGMKPLLSAKTEAIPLSKMSPEEASCLGIQLRALKGVKAVALRLEEQMAYLTVDPEIWDPAVLEPVVSSLGYGLKH